MTQARLYWIAWTLPATSGDVEVGRPAPGPRALTVSGGRQLAVGAGRGLALSGGRGLAVCSGSRAVEVAR